MLSENIIVINFLVAKAEGQHLFPSRTQKLSPPASMVLQGRPCGRVDRCQNFIILHPILGVFFILIIFFILVKGKTFF